MKYKYIHAWGKFMGSFPYYINGEVAKAAKENAPETAIYKGHDGVWATFEGIKNVEAKQYIASLVESFRPLKSYKMLFHLEGKYDLSFTVEAENEEHAVTVATQELTDDGIISKYIINLIEIS